MGILETKIKDLKKDENGDCLVPIDEDVIEAVLGMAQEFDASENEAITKIEVIDFLISDSGWGSIETKVKIEQGRYHHIRDADYWNPAEGDWDFDETIEDIAFEGEGITQEMTVQEAIDKICSDMHDCKGFEDEMYELTRDLDDSDFEPDYDDYDD